MSTKINFICVALLLCVCMASGCRRTGCVDPNSCNYDPKAKIDDFSCIDKGKATFWQSTARDGYDIVVTVNATEATITDQQTATPLCDAPGCATFSLCPGTHHYTAYEAFPGLESWEGNVTVSEGGCMTIQLE